MQTSIFEKILAGILFIFTLPLFVLFRVLIQLEDAGPLFFRQRRLGKDRKPFTIYKIRTMVVGAERLRGKYKGLNEADTPVFKIYNDPRYTKLGKFLAHTGLDELPQLINIIKGEMKFVGPRPLPDYEAKKVPGKYRGRFSVYPGITSLWIVKGAHNLSFKRWMELDIKQINSKKPWADLVIAIGTLKIIIFSLGAALRKHLWLLLAFALVALGFYLRLKLVLGKTFWGDELLYLDNGVVNSLKDLIAQNYYIADNPPLFSIFLKIWSLVSKEINWLRVPGLIIYLVSCRLLLAIFKKAGAAVKLFILFVFGLSPYFVNVNSWVSPYNFLLLFSLIQIILLDKLLDGRFRERPLGFIVPFSLLNFLMFFTHYAAIYFFSGYLFLLGYILFRKKSLLKTFLWSLAVSFVLILPPISLLLRRRSQIESLLEIRSPLVFSSPLAVYVFIIRRSILRLGSLDLKTLALVGLPLIIFFRKTNRYLVYFASFYILPATLLYFVNPIYPGIASERAYLFFHLGFYFFLAGALIAAGNINGKLYALVWLTFIVIFASVYILPSDEGSKGYFPGNAVTVRLERGDYQRFTDKLKRSLSEGNYDTLLLAERDHGQIQQKQIFYLYYYTHSREFAEIRKSYVKYTNLFQVDIGDPNDINEVYAQTGEKILLVNFEEGQVTDVLFKGRAEKETDVINYWEYFPGYE